jgi:hypothetical protein
MNEDPLHTVCLPVYIGCLVELKKVTGKHQAFDFCLVPRLMNFILFSELFKVSHKMVETLPNTALGWYSVGSYYFAIGNYRNN